MSKYRRVRSLLAVGVFIGQNVESLSTAEVVLMSWAFMLAGVRLFDGSNEKRLLIDESCTPEFMFDTPVKSFEDVGTARRLGGGLEEGGVEHGERKDGLWSGLEL